MSQVTEPVTAPAATPAATPAPAAAATPPVVTPPAAATEPPKSPSDSIADPAAEPKGHESAPVVPSEYKFTLPDGIQLDEARFGEFSVIAKELKLTQAQADQVVGLEVKRIQAEQAAFATQHKGWVDTIHADPDLGGQNFDATLALIKSAATRFFNPEALAVMKDTKLIDHPAIARGLRDIGKALGEDTRRGNSGGDSDPNSEEAMHRTMYPSMFNEDGTPKK